MVSCQVAELMAGEGSLNEGSLFRRWLVHILLGTLVRIRDVAIVVDIIGNSWSVSQA